jgi:hypothetical protein
MSALPPKADKEQTGCYEELHATFRELAELRSAYTELASRHCRVMRDHAVEEAQHEREREPWRMQSTGRSSIGKMPRAEAV